MTEDQVLAQLARHAIKDSLPAADSVRSQVLAQWQDRAVVLAEPVVAQRMLDPVQILLLAVSGEWIVWQTGSYEAWLTVEGSTGVVVKSYRVDPDAVAVRFSDQMSQVLAVGLERRAHAILWSVAEESDWRWPTVEEILFDDWTQRPMTSELAITRQHLITEYVAELLGEPGWAWDVLADLIDADPALAIDALIEAANEAHNDDIVCRIGAGHLESVIRRHGLELDGILASAATGSAAIRLALQSVWAPLPPTTSAVVGSSMKWKS